MAAIDDITGKRLWLRAKDLGGGGSSVTSWPDAGPLGQIVASVGTAPTVLATGTPLSGKAVDFVAGGFTISRSTATASSSFSSTYLPNNCMDDKASTYWHTSSTSMPQWYQEKTTNARVVTGYSITAFGTSGPAAWTFEGSAGGSSWTTLDTRSGVSWSSGETKTYTFSNSTAYAYHRIHVTSVGGDGYLRWTSAKFTGTELGPSGDGTLWMVVKSDLAASSTLQGAWEFGAGTDSSHYAFSGVVYEGAGATARRSFTPTGTHTNWRKYKVRVSGTTWTAHLDGTLQATATVTPGWRLGTALLGRNNAAYNFDGRIAEVLWIDHASDSTEDATVEAYLEAEHFTAPSGLGITDATATASAAAHVETLTIPLAITDTTASASAAAHLETVSAALRRGWGIALN